MPQPQKPKAKPQTVQVGRHTRTLPASTATPEQQTRTALEHQLKRNEALRAAQAVAARDAQARERALQLESYRSNVRANATSFFARDVAGPELAKAVHNVEHAFDRHVRAGFEPKAFDVVLTCKEVRFRRGHGNVPPAPTATALADQRLPPASQQSMGAIGPKANPRPGAEPVTPPGVDSERQEWMGQQEAARLRELTARQRDAENLKRWGLQDPRTYAPCG